jgi:hypothetical protein
MLHSEIEGRFLLKIGEYKVIFVGKNNVGPVVDNDSKQEQHDIPIVNKNSDRSMELRRHASTF